jgi:hypothetical protein
LEAVKEPDERPMEAGSLEERTGSAGRKGRRGLNQDVFQGQPEAATNAPFHFKLKEAIPPTPSCERQGVAAGTKNLCCHDPISALNDFPE